MSSNAFDSLVRAENEADDLREHARMEAKKEEITTCSCWPGETCLAKNGSPLCEAMSQSVGTPKAGAA